MLTTSPGAIRRWRDGMPWTISSLSEAQRLAGKTTIPLESRLTAELVNPLLGVLVKLAGADARHDTIDKLAQHLGHYLVGTVHDLKLRL